MLAYGGSLRIGCFVFHKKQKWHASIDTRITVIQSSTSARRSFIDYASHTHTYARIKNIQSSNEVPISYRRNSLKLCKRK